MIASKKNKKLLIVVFILIIVLISVGIIIFFTKNERNKPMVNSHIESSTRHKISHYESTILAFDSTPLEVVNTIKEYIINNEYVHNDINFVFLNSKYTYSLLLYPSYSPFPQYYGYRNDTPFIYNVAQSYNNIFMGYMTIDENGNILEDNFMTIDELSKIQTQPEIGLAEAYRLAREYLDLEKNIKIDNCQRFIYNVPNVDEIIFCYRVQFKDRDDYIYINGITGEKVE